MLFSISHAGVCGIPHCEMPTFETFLGPPIGAEFFISNLLMIAPARPPPISTITMLHHRSYCLCVATCILHVATCTLQAFHFV